MGRTDRSRFNAFVLAVVATFGSLAVPEALRAQEPVVFRSTQSANLPTAQTIRSGNLMFEISHRFAPISGGSDRLWGLDGPVFNRLGLAWAPTDRVMIGVQRSNLDGNLELNAKGRFLEGGGAGFRYQVGAMGGAAWNTSAAETATVESNEAQYYAQVMLNARAGERFALGVVPTFIRNPRIDDPEPENGFAVGLHGQFWVAEGVSLIGEWILTEESDDFPHDPLTFGIDLQTRGHVFKLVASNQMRMNPTQYLAGSRDGYDSDAWRLGFNITRVLSF
jgi:hypothetical protein